MKICVAFYVAVAFMFAFEPLWAADMEANNLHPVHVDWSYPRIVHYGGVLPDSGLPYKLNPVDSYKILVDVSSNSSNRKIVPTSLLRLARLINLFGLYKVPEKNVHIVAVLENGALFSALRDSKYNILFGVQNPSGELLKELHDSGVEILVCSQEMAEFGITKDDIDSNVNVSVSSLSDMAIFGHDGYSYMRL